MVEGKGDNIEVFQMDREDYGRDFYCDHLLEQYKLFVELADRVNNRRNTTNIFFLTTNTVLVSIFGAISEKYSLTILSKDFCLLLFSAAGITFSLAWLYTVRSYRQISIGKFEIIHILEERLPAAIFKAEWKILGEGKDPNRFRPLTQIEMYAPKVFIIIYIIILLSWVVGEAMILACLPQ